MDNLGCLPRPPSPSARPANFQRTEALRHQALEDLQRLAPALFEAPCWLERDQPSEDVTRLDDQLELIVDDFRRVGRKCKPIFAESSGWRAPN